MKRLLYIWIVLLLSNSAFSQVTFVIDRIPSKTPIKDTIYLASSTNQWNTHDNAFAFKTDVKGNLSLTFSCPADTIEYKLCRGGWSSVEVDSLGGDIKNRVYTKAQGNDVRLKIFGWRDLFPKRKSTASKSVSYMPTNIEIPQLNRKRTIRIYFPPNYSSGNKFPVIYMHDGQNLFDDATAYAGEWRVDEILDSLYTYHHFSCIVVGIYHGEKERINELSPWKNDSLGLGGDGDKYAKFIVKTLKPFIDSHYRTLPDRDHTATIGSSMGGLMSLYLAVEYSDVFGKIGIFSPSLWFSSESFKQIQKYKPKKIQKIYLTSGAKEGVSVVQNTLKADSLFRSIGFDDNFYRCKISKKGQHNESSWSHEFEDAVRFLFNF